MDRLEFRLKNAIRNPDGSESVLPALLRAAADAIGWRRDAETRGHGDTAQAASPRLPLPASPPRLVGRGLGIAARNMGGGTGSSDITVNPDGTVTAVTSAPDVGTGTLTVVAAVVAESFGIP